MPEFFLKREQRDEILSSMNPDQLAYIRTVKQGRRSKLLQHVADIKGGAGEDVALLLSRWEIINYEDAVERVLVCEHCGNSTLRYRFTILNNDTGEISKIGKQCMETFTGMPPSVALEVFKGNQTIELELDEILSKFQTGWDISDYLVIPNEVKFPDEFLTPISLGIPLIDRQVKRLENAIRKYLWEKSKKEAEERQKSLAAEYERRAEQRRQELAQARQAEQQRRIQQYKKQYSNQAPSQSRFPEPPNELFPHPWGIPVLKQINAFLNSDATSQEKIANLLVSFFNFAQGKYLNGKYEIYYLVGRYLDFLANQGFVRIVEETSKDRKFVLLKVQNT